MLANLPTDTSVANLLGSLLQRSEPLLTSAKNLISVIEPHDVVDLDTLEYSMQNGSETDSEALTTLALVGEILNTLGVLGFFISFIISIIPGGPLSSPMISSYAYQFLGLALSTGSLAAAIYGLLAFLDFTAYNTAYNAFRAWKINFMVIWISVGLSLLCMAGFLAGMKQGISVASVVLFAAPTTLIGFGVLLMWNLKQLWILEDPDRSLAGQYFDYFGTPDLDSSEDEAEDTQTATDSHHTSDSKTTIETNNTTTDSPTDKTTTDSKPTDTTTTDSTTTGSTTTNSTSDDQTEGKTTETTSETTNTTPAASTGRKTRYFDVSNFMGFEELPVAF